MREEPNETITITLIQETYPVKVTYDLAEYLAAKAAGMLDHLIDCHASDMETTTIIIEPNGTRVYPYRFVA